MRLVPVLLAAAVLAGCGHGSDLAGEGRKVFAAQHCGDCHSRGGTGPDFATSEQLDRAQILVELNSGEGGMPSYRDRLSAHQEAAVTEFVFQTMHDRP